MVRFYLVPAVSVVLDAAGHYVRGPQFFNWFRAPAPVLFPTADWEARDYGVNPTMLVAAALSDADDATLAAQAGVTKFADNLDAPVGTTALAALQAALEADSLPGGIVTAATTYRQVVRGVMGIFGVAQCMQGDAAHGSPTLFGGGVTLATAFGALPLATQASLSMCLSRLSYDVSQLTAATTLRQVLTRIANTASPSPMLGVTV